VKRSVKLVMALLMVVSARGFAIDILTPKPGSIVELSLDPVVGNNMTVTWWNQDKLTGKRLILSTNLNMQYNDISRTIHSPTVVNEVGSFATGEYDWSIKRTAHKSIEGLFWYSGAGVELSVFRSVNSSNNIFLDNTEFTENSVQTISVIGFAVPLGIDYAVFKSIPNLSVSIEARPTLGASYSVIQNDSSSGSNDGHAYTLYFDIKRQLFVNYLFD